MLLQESADDIVPRSTYHFSPAKHGPSQRKHLLEISIAVLIAPKRNRERLTLVYGVLLRAPIFVSLRSSIEMLQVIHRLSERGCVVGVHFDHFLEAIEAGLDVA